ncbi:MAG TPA: AAA family ATPase [Spirochaetia bacterium]|nr:AAA family ATPase [Spirochaetia bacterium]HTZ52138.1 AAA family ATPase [Spirochaetia bacterium]
MGKIVVLANQKGGVGKTTTAVNLGAYLAEAGKRILLVDFDPQSNTSSSVGARKDAPGVYDLIMGKVSAGEAIQPCSVANLFIIASNIDLTGASVELVDQEGREYYLKRSLEPLTREYDYILIDCPPSLGILTLNGLAAADFVIIPLQCEYFALEGLSQLLKTVNRVQKGVNKELKIGGILFTMYDSRTRLAHDVVQEVTGYFKQKVFRTIIPRNVRLSEAPSFAKPINQYDRECIGALSYQKLAEEVLLNV